MSNKDTNKFDENNQRRLKYFLKSSSNLDKHWNLNEYKDAVSESSRLSKIMLASMEVRDLSDTPLYKTLTLSEVIQAWNHLKFAIQQLPSNDSTWMSLVEEINSSKTIQQNRLEKY